MKVNLDEPSFKGAVLSGFVNTESSISRRIWIGLMQVGNSRWKELPRQGFSLKQALKKALFKDSET